MTRALAHRGPDGSGTWSADCHSAGSQTDRWKVSLGHTRLSILDLSDLGSQPMLSPDGRTAIAYNGEVYNYRALRAELETLGHVFLSSCDTETVLHSYLEWGTEAFARFNGMFALAIWDGNRERLVLARDRLGIKPLYFQQSEAELIFGSELGALRAHPDFKPEIDRDSLETFLRCGFTMGRETIYRHTRRLFPGTFAVWEHGALREQSYWSLTDFAPREDTRRFDAVVDELELILGDAVERRMIADVPLGAFLSGGVDSSVIVSIMAERSREKVRSFSIGFKETAFDEAPHAKAVARHLGTDHTEHYVTREQALGVVEELPMLYDEPYADPSAVPTVLLSRLTREQVTVSLSGDGGDELFGGYARYARLALLLKVQKLPRAVLRAAKWIARGVGPSYVRNGLAKLDHAETSAQLAEAFLERFEEPDARRLCERRGSRRATVYGETFRTAQGGSDVRRAMYAEARSYLNDDVLTKVDRATMSIGLEARVPILDHTVVEFAFSLPESALNHGGQTKAPLRALAQRRVPRELLDRPKQGFQFPISELVGDRLEAWVDRYLAASRIGEEGFFDPPSVAQLRTAPRDFLGVLRLWRMICFERWYAHHHRGEPGH